MYHEKLMKLDYRSGIMTCNVTAKLNETVGEILT